MCETAYKILSVALTHLSQYSLFLLDDISSRRCQNAVNTSCAVLGDASLMNVLMSVSGSLEGLSMPGSASDAGFESFISFWLSLCFIYCSDFITSGKVFEIGLFFFFFSVGPHFIL